MLALLFWIGYLEVVNFLLSSWLGYSFWWTQPVVAVLALFMLTITLGSQTRGE